MLTRYSHLFGWFYATVMVWLIRSLAELLLYWKILICQYRKFSIKCITFWEKGLLIRQLISSVKYLFRETGSIQAFLTSQGAVKSYLTGQCSEKHPILKNTVHCTFPVLFHKTGLYCLHVNLGENNPENPLPPFFFLQFLFDFDVAVFW